MIASFEFYKKLVVGRIIISFKKLL